MLIAVAHALICFELGPTCGYPCLVLVVNLCMLGSTVLILGAKARVVVTCSISQLLMHLVPVNGNLFCQVGAVDLSSRALSQRLSVNCPRAQPLFRKKCSCILHVRNAVCTRPTYMSAWMGYAAGIYECVDGICGWV